jgi:hypothetical protein
VVWPGRCAQAHVVACSVTAGGGKGSPSPAGCPGWPSLDGTVPPRRTVRDQPNRRVLTRLASQATFSWIQTRGACGQSWRGFELSYFLLWSLTCSMVACWHLKACVRVCCLFGSPAVCLTNHHGPGKWTSRFAEKQARLGAIFTVPLQSMYPLPVQVSSRGGVIRLVRFQVRAEPLVVGVRLSLACLVMMQAGTHS